MCFFAGFGGLRQHVAGRTVKLTEYAVTITAKARRYVPLTPSRVGWDAPEFWEMKPTKIAVTIPVTKTIHLAAATPHEAAELALARTFPPDSVWDIKIPPVSASLSASVEPDLFEVLGGGGPGRWAVAPGGQWPNFAEAMAVARERQKASPGWYAVRRFGAVFPMPGSVLGPDEGSSDE